MIWVESVDSFWPEVFCSSLFMYFRFCSLIQAILINYHCVLRLFDCILSVHSPTYHVFLH